MRAACSWLRRSGDAGDLGPSLKGLGPGGSILGGGHLMAAEQEEVVDPVMGGEETLRLARRLEALHLSFSLSRGRSQRRFQRRRRWNDGGGWCEFSALLLRPLCFLRSTEGITSRLAAP